MRIFTFKYTRILRYSENLALLSSSTAVFDAYDEFNNYTLFKLNYIQLSIEVRKTTVNSLPIKLYLIVANLYVRSALDK